MPRKLLIFGPLKKSKIPEAIRHNQWVIPDGPIELGRRVLCAPDDKQFRTCEVVSCFRGSDVTANPPDAPVTFIDWKVIVRFEDGTEFTALPSDLLMIHDTTWRNPMEEVREEARRVVRKMGYTE